MRLSFLSKLNTLWLGLTYPFAAFGRGVSVHYSCDIQKSMAAYIRLCDETYLAPDVWLHVVHESGTPEPKITVSKGCKIGRRSTISAKNSILLGEDVLLAPSVLIMDHNHEFADPALPIHSQGVNAGGRITIGQNCWLGHGAVVSCGRGELVLGRNCVVGAGAVVTRSFPAFSVIAGNPARVIRKYDETSERWIRVDDLEEARRAE